MCQEVWIDQQSLHILAFKDLQRVGTESVFLIDTLKISEARVLMIL